MAKRSSTAALGADLAKALKRKGFDVRTLEMSSEITVSMERAPWMLVESIFLRFDEEAGQHVWCWSAGDAIGPAHDHEYRTAAPRRCLRSAPRERNSRVFTGGTGDG